MPVVVFTVIFIILQLSEASVVINSLARPEGLGSQKPKYISVAEASSIISAAAFNWSIMPVAANGGKIVLAIISILLLCTNTRHQ